MDKSLSLKQKNLIAQESDKNIDKFKQLASISYLYIGKELKKVRDEKLYLYLGESPEYQTLESYVNSKNIDLRKAYYLIQIYEKFCLQFKFKPEDLSDIHWTALREILPVSRIENAKDMVEKARTLTRGDLEKEVRQLKLGIKDLSDLQKHKCAFKKIEYWKCTICGEISKVRPSNDEIIK